VCVQENVTRHRTCRDLSYWIESSDKVRALKAVFSNDLNENGKV
jgi:hypothetical protein